MNKFMSRKNVNPPYAENRSRTNSQLAPPFCGYSSFEAQADNALVVCVEYKGKLVFLSVLFPALCSNFCSEKNYLLCLRFLFGGNRKRELGEVFSPLQFTVSRKCLTKIFFFLYVCVCIRRWQAAPLSFFLFSFFFFLLLEGLSLIGMGLACLCHPTFF